MLQVHSLDRPKSLDAAFLVCDPLLAWAAVEQAASFGTPFRVALPTYGYVLAFATNGQFVGLSAEGPAKSWPPSAPLREVRSDPTPMARLVQGWTFKKPAALRGLIWYRLPVAVDNLNWRWPTLRAILGLRLPRQSVRAQSRRVEAGLIEIDLVNDGELDVSSRLAVMLPYTLATLLYCFNDRGEVLLLERAQEPNLGLWSPPGGKLDTVAGESPYLCACREAREELGLDLRCSDLHLSGLISEEGYPGQGHWLLFLFEVKPKLTSLPPVHREGRFQFFTRQALTALPQPRTDRERIWPWFWQYRGGFFAAHCRCTLGGLDEWRLEEAFTENDPLTWSCPKPVAGRGGSVHTP